VEKKRRDEVYISPSKKRTVQREVAKQHRKVLSEFRVANRVIERRAVLPVCAIRFTSRIWLQSTTGLHEMSTDEASYWRKNNSKRHLTSKYTSPVLPWPIREDWDRVEQLHPFVLELSYANGPAQHKDTWRKSMCLIRNVPGVDRLD
jgi:hypothetical protein